MNAIARRRVRATFARLSQGDWPAVAGQMAADVHHVFPGDHPLGGERHSRDAVLRWLERLGRLYPGHEFEVHRVVSGGWPWDLWIAAKWTARLRPAVGPTYLNEGSHWLRVRWGKVTYFHAFLDTQLIERACREMAQAGISEAEAKPILGHLG